jgi:hypothetical protein
MRRTKPITDPRILAAQERAGRAQIDSERWYRKLRLAFNWLEKARRTCLRAQKLIKRLTAEAEQAEAVK